MESSLADQKNPNGELPVQREPGSILVTSVSSEVLAVVWDLYGKLCFSLKFLNL